MGLRHSTYAVKAHKVNSMTHWAVYDETTGHIIKVFPHAEWDDARKLARERTEQSKKFTAMLERRLNKGDKGQ